LNSLQTVAVQFTDESSCLPRVSFDLIERFKAEIRNWVLNYDRSLPKDELETRVEDLYVEAAMVVATYNMVSRFLLSTDVAGMSDMEVPWPVDRKEASSFINPFFFSWVTLFFQILNTALHHHTVFPSGQRSKA